MYVFRVSVSLFCGYPKSMISTSFISLCSRNEASNNRTIDKLIYQHEIALHRLLVDLPEVRTRNGNEAVTKLEDERSIGIISIKHQLSIQLLVELGYNLSLGHCHNVEIVRPDMEEARGSQGYDR